MPDDVSEADDAPEFLFERDTFRPPTVDDRFEKRVRDDHAANQALHDTLEASQDPDVDGSAKTVYNFMATHAPGEKPDGPAPRYHVTAEFRNEKMGHPSIEDPVRRLIDRGAVRLIDVLECGDDHLRVKLRPVERTVEPIEVPYADLPDDVFGFDTIVFNAKKVLKHAIEEEGSNRKTYEAARALAVVLHLIDPDTTDRSIPAGENKANEWIKQLSESAEWYFEEDESGVEWVHFPDMGVPCATYECTNNASETQRYQFRSGFVVDLPLCDECFEDFDPETIDAEPWRNNGVYHSITFGDGKTLEIPEFEDAHDATDAAAAIIREFGQDFAPPEVAIKMVGALDGWEADPVSGFKAHDMRRYDVELFNDAYGKHRDPDKDFDYFSEVWCGCGDFAVSVPRDVHLPAIDVVCPECGNHFGHGAAADEPCPCRHDHDDLSRDPDFVRREDVAKGLRQLADRIEVDEDKPDVSELYAVGRHDAAGWVRMYADEVDYPSTDIRTAHLAPFVDDDAESIVEDALREADDRPKGPPEDFAEAERRGMYQSGPNPTDDDRGSEE